MLEVLLDPWNIQRTKPKWRKFGERKFNLKEGEGNQGKGNPGN